jgi:hypothetical protein
VPKAGIEPARLAAVDFESTASTDFATSALKGMRKTLWIIPLPPVSATPISRQMRNCLKKRRATLSLPFKQRSGYITYFATTAHLLTTAQ